MNDLIRGPLGPGQAKYYFADPKAALKKIRPAYLRTAAVRRLVKEHNHRVGQEFLMALDRQVADLVARACSIHNGGKKTLDGLVLNYVTGKLKG